MVCRPSMLPARSGLCEFRRLPGERALISATKVALISRMGLLATGESELCARHRVDSGVKTDLNQSFLQIIVLLKANNIKNFMIYVKNFIYLATIFTIEKKLGKSLPYTLVRYI